MQEQELAIENKSDYIIRKNERIHYIDNYWQVRCTTDYIEFSSD
jgi:hypothetical protein